MRITRSNRCWMLNFLLRRWLKHFRLANVGFDRIVSQCGWFALFFNQVFLFFEVVEWRAIFFSSAYLFHIENTVLVVVRTMLLWQNDFDTLLASKTVLHLFTCERNECRSIEHQNASEEVWAWLKQRHSTNWIHSKFILKKKLKKNSFFLACHGDNVNTTYVDYYLQWICISVRLWQ